MMNKTILHNICALAGGAGIGHLLFSNTKYVKDTTAIVLLAGAVGSWVPFFGSVGFLCGTNSYRLWERKVLEESKKQV